MAKIALRQRWYCSIALLLLALSFSRRAQAAGACTKDAKRCDDGSVVGRDPGNNCKFKKCPELDDSPVACTADAKQCEDGSFVSRNPARDCKFDECPVVVVDCLAGMRKCSANGVDFEVPRNPDDNCNFYDCDLKCCDPENIPMFIEGAKCCGVTGEWVGSIGDGRTFFCAGVQSSGPNYPPPFGEPCPEDNGCPEDARLCPDQTIIFRDANCEFPKCPPANCSAIGWETRCDYAADSGCRWLRGRNKCVREADTECKKLKTVQNCRKFSHCKWRRKGGRNRCISRCKKPNLETACTREHKPVKCGGDSCEYSNLCVARAAGYKAGSCKRVCTNSEQCDSQKEVCHKDSPEKSETGICVRKDTKNFCGGFEGFQCPIGKRCVADVGSRDACIRHGCKRPAKSKKCGGQFNPVVCGSKSCTYKNACLAKAAGFNAAKECRGYCPKPDPRLGCGPASFPGFRCGGGNCHYSNRCVARAVGFKEKQCRQDCAFATCAIALQCPSGQEPKLLPDECCPRCVEKKCDLSACETPDCRSPKVLLTPPGECCPVCTHDCTKSPVRCAVPDDCPKHLQYIPEGECCPRCREKKDCSLVRCAQPSCLNGQIPFTPLGECCSKCPPRDMCEGHVCADPNCPPGKMPVTWRGECCPRCEFLPDR